MPHEDAIADAQVLDQVTVRVDIVADLEVLATVLLRRLFVFVRNDEIVDDSLNRRCFVVKVALVLFDALFAAEEHEAVAQVLLLTVHRCTERVPLHVVSDLSVHWRGRVSPLRVVADQAERVDLDFFAFDERGGALNGHFEHGGVISQCFFQSIPVLQPLVVLVAASE